MKRDINLLPQKRTNSPQRTKAILITFMLLVLYVLIFGVAIVLPMNLKNATILHRNLLDAQIIELQPQVDEHDTLVTEFGQLQQMMDSAGAIIFNKYNALDALDAVQSMCPDGIIILSINNSDMAVKLSCKADNNYQIAQFALELERCGMFQNVTISGSAPADVVSDGDTQSVGGTAVSFEIYLVYDLTPESEVADEAAQGGAA